MGPPRRTGCVAGALPRSVVDNRTAAQLVVTRSVTRCNLALRSANSARSRSSAQMISSEIASAFSRSARPASVSAMATERSRSEEHTSELQSRQYLVCRLLLEKKKKQHQNEVL